MKPSNFTNKPIDSVLQKSEAETVARNIMVILANTGDNWRTLRWSEYCLYRKNEGNFNYMEKLYFDQVKTYCKNADAAKSFSKAWNKTK